MYVWRSNLSTLFDIPKMTLALYVQIRLNQAAAKGHCVIINTMYLLYHILLEVRVSGSGIREELIQKSFRLIFKQLQK